MFRNIVWATDGSEFADRALAYAKDLALTSDAKLYAVHTEEHLTGGRSSGIPVRVDEDDVRARIRAQVEDAREDGFDASLEIVQCTAGHTPRAISDFARSIGAEVIVVGTRGHTPLAGALLGSVAQGLLHDARCPVLAVPARTVAARKEALAVADA